METGSCKTLISANKRKRQLALRLTLSQFLLFIGIDNLYYMPDDVRFIRWAPNFGAAGLATLALLVDNGLALVVGAGAAMAAQGSSSSVWAVFKFKGLAVFGAGAAIDPHKSSSSSLLNFGVLLDSKFEARISK